MRSAWPHVCSYVSIKIKQEGHVLEYNIRSAQYVIGPAPEK